MQSKNVKYSINNYLMEKRYEAEIAVNSDQVDKYIIDAARVKPGGAVAPDKGKTLALALGLGLLLPLGFVLIRDIFNDKIMDLEEVKRLSAIPVLSTIPASKQGRIKSLDDRSALAEAFPVCRWQSVSL